MKSCCTPGVRGADTVVVGCAEDLDTNIASNFIMIVTVIAGTGGKVRKQGPSRRRLPDPLQLNSSMKPLDIGTAVVDRDHRQESSISAIIVVCLRRRNDAAHRDRLRPHSPLSDSAGAPPPTSFTARTRKLYWCIRCKIRHGDTGSQTVVVQSVIGFRRLSNACTRTWRSSRRRCWRALPKCR